jgi:hypothetical protein
MGRERVEKVERDDIRVIGADSTNLLRGSAASFEIGPDGVALGAE